MNSGKVLLGVLAGVAVGATLGILFAPARGKSTRRKISRKSDEYADELKKTFNAFVGSISKKAKKMKEEASLMAEFGKQEVEDVEAEVTNAVK
jgi:gas vesicle protein